MIHRPLRLETLEDRAVPATVAYQVPAGTVGAQAYSGPLGMDFNVNEGVIVTRLGAFDSGSDGLNLPITVRLYNRATQSELVSLTFEPGAGTLIGGSRFLPLATPLVLAPGFQGTIVAEGYGAAEPDGNAGFQTATWTADGAGQISFVGSGRLGSVPGTFPAQTDTGSVNPYAAGTFEFQAMSEIVTGPAAAAQGLPYGLSLNLSHALNVTGWTLDWGDGHVEWVAGNPSQAIHTYATTGTFTIAASAADSVAGAIGTGYHHVVQALNPAAYWRLGETSVSASAAHDEVDGLDGRYENFSVDDANRPGALAGDPDSAVNFDGPNNFVLTPDLAPRFTDETVTLSVWFNARGPGVLVDELGQAALNGAWHDSQIEILASGEVRVRVWGLSPVSVGTVTFNTWHNVVLRYDRATLTLNGFLDGAQAAGSSTGNRSAPWESGNGQHYALGAGDSTNLGSGAYFNGLLDEFAVYNRALTAAEIASQYQAGITTGGNYAAQVTAAGPVLYWRLGDASVASVAEDVAGNLDAVYHQFSEADLGQPGGLRHDSNASARFNGSNYVRLPAAAFGTYPTSGANSTYVRSFSAWFRTTSGGVILGQTSGTSYPGGPAPGGWVPAAYVGTDGKVRASFFYHGSSTPITSAGTYNDGQWHHLVTTYGGGVESLYLDGQLAAQRTVSQGGYSSAYNYYLGTGYVPTWPGTPGGWYGFNGHLDDAAVFATALTPQQVQAQYLAGTSNKKMVPVETPPVTVPEVSAGPDVQITEGTTFTRSGTFADSSYESPWTAVVDYGDGTGQQPLVLNGNSYSLSHLYAEQGSYSVVVSVTNKDGQVGTDTFVVTAANAAPSLAAPSAQNGSQGVSSAFTLGSFTDAGPDDPWLVEVDWGDGFTSTFSTDTAGPLGEQAHVYAAGGAYTVLVKVTDKDGASGTATFQVEVANVAPIVTAAADQSAAEGTPSAFSLGSFTDPGPDSPWLVEVDWGDGFGTSFSTTTPGSLGSQSHVYAATGTYVVLVKVTDKDGATGTATFQVNVSGGEVSAALQGPDTGVRGQVRTFVFSATGSSGAAGTGFTYTVDWGDGSPVQTVTGSGAGVAVDHVFGRTGSYTVLLTAADGTGNVSPAVTGTIEITPWAVQTQPDPDGTGSVETLVVGGTGGDDFIHVGLTDEGEVRVMIKNPQTQVPLRQVFAQPIGRIVVYGQGGDDRIVVANDVGIPAELYGGGGNDSLQGGPSSTLLVGGAGHDVLLAGKGRSVLIGGRGNDLLAAGGAAILIGGTTDFDANEIALRAVLAEWSSPASYATRVAHLQGAPGGRNGSFFLTDDTVHDDRAADLLFGPFKGDWVVTRRRRR